MNKISDDILRYHKGEMSAAERHALEKKALSDPFLADALEGAGQISAADFAQDVAELKHKIAGRARPLFTPLRIAAGIVLLVGAGWLALNMLNANEPAQLTMTDQKPAPTSAQGDTLTKIAEKPSVAEGPKKDQLLALENSKKGRTEKTKESPTAKKLEQYHLTETLAVADEPTVAQELAEEDFTELRLALSSDTLDKRVATQQAQPVLAEGFKAERQDARAAGTAKVKSAPTSDKAASGLADLSPPMITGKVTLADDGLALPGVSVRVKGSTKGTVTDFNGNYSIEGTGQSSTLVFSFVGMQTAEATPKSGSTLDVALSEDVSQLSEVVVTGRKIPPDADDDSPVIKLAEPVGGLRAYDKYLDASLRYPQQAIENNVKGRVTVQFTVGITGGLDEFTVMKSLGFGCDEEVIRLVKEGPAWNPTTENKVPTESLVRVRVKFDPAKAKR